MAKVILHEATDGSLHKNKTACDKHEVGLRVREKSNAANYDLTSVSSVDDDQNQAIYVENLTDFVVANADTLRKLLNDSLVAKRVRKTVAKGNDAAAGATA